MVVPLSRRLAGVAAWLPEPPAVWAVIQGSPMLWPLRLSTQWQGLRRALRYAAAVVLAFAVTASLPLVF